jgi:hypothetical protein
MLDQFPAAREKEINWDRTGRAVMANSKTNNLCFFIFVFSNLIILKESE